MVLKAPQVTPMYNSSWNYVGKKKGRKKEALRESFRTMAKVECTN